MNKLSTKLRNVVQIFVPVAQLEITLLTSRKNHGLSSVFPETTNSKSNHHLKGKNAIPMFKYFQDPSRRPGQLNSKHIPSTITIQLTVVAKMAEEVLGIENFSVYSSLGHVFGSFNEIIKLFTLKNSHEDHPLFYLSRLLESETKYECSRGTGINPYPLWRGMMILLATDIFGYSENMKMASSEILKVTIDRHSRMAKIVEIAYLSQQIHQRILDSEDMSTLPKSTVVAKAEERNYIAKLHNANKTATLVGDLLWAQTCAHMASLKCQEVSELICEFLIDYCEKEFVFGMKTKDVELFNPESWFHKTQLGLGSIMGTTMSSTLLFSGHGKEIRDAGYRLGVLLALTYQAYDDIKYFENDTLEVSTWIDMGLLPVVYKIFKEPQLLKESPSHIFHEVKNDQLVLQKANETLQILQEDTLDYLQQISTSVTTTEQSRIILERFIMSLSVGKCDNLSRVSGF